MADDPLDYTTINQPNPELPASEGFGDPIDITIGSDVPNDEEGEIDPQSGALKIEIADGSVTIDLDPRPKRTKTIANEFDGNLADDMPETELLSIAGDLLNAIEIDDQSRQEWLKTRGRGIDLLGLRLEEPRGDTGSSSAPVEGMSTVRNPLLLEAVTRFQSNASAELLPAAGPVKVRNDTGPKPKDSDTAANPNAPRGIGDNGGPPMQDTDELAEALEKDMNFYLTSVDRGYRADTDRMLFWVGFGGCGFKKVYNDPIKRMPLSRSVDAEDLIVSNNENDLDDCRRITHKIMMRKSQIIRMQLAGVYRDIPLQTATYTANEFDVKKSETQGINPNTIRPEDNLYTVYECYAELNLPGFEHEDEDGHATGLELPYRVTIEKDSRQILEIRRNWKQDDDNCLAKKVFVKYPFVPAFGFYEIGLLHMLGNATRALTAAWREALDSGMFANFPGFLYADYGGRQVTNEFRVPPGGGQKIQTGGKPIQQAVMPLPYKEMGAGFMQFIQNVEMTAQRVGGTAELQVGEGKQDAPVGTTLALIEQATKMLSAVHVRLHAAQSEEFQLLADRFREDPEALWRKNKRPAIQWQVDQFLQALDTYDLVPAADPNNPSHMQRIMKAIAIKQLQAMNPGLYNAEAVDRRILNMIGLTDVDHLFNPNPQPPPNPDAQQPPVDPAKMAAVQLKAQTAAQDAQEKQQDRQDKAQTQAQESAARQKELAVESADRAEDRASRERVAQIREQTEQLKTQAEVAMHQLPSGDAKVGAQADLAQHVNPSGDAQAAAHASLAQHLNPSADATLGAQTTLAQHVNPSGDAQTAAIARAAQPTAPSAESGGIWKRPI